MINALYYLSGEIPFTTTGEALFDAALFFFFFSPDHHIDLWIQGE